MARPLCNCEQLADVSAGDPLPVARASRGAGWALADRRVTSIRLVAGRGSPEPIPSLRSWTS